MTKFTRIEGEDRLRGRIPLFEEDEDDFVEFEEEHVEPEEAASNYLWGHFIPVSTGKRPLNAFFKLMLEAKKRGVQAFVYNDKVYQGKRHEKLGMIYKKA